VASHFTELTTDFESKATFSKKVKFKTLEFLTAASNVAGCRDATKRFELTCCFRLQVFGPVDGCG
jgi:hypothetical protein